MTDIKQIGVVGAGQMGRGIAQVAAFTGYKVTVFVINQEALDFGRPVFQATRHQR